MKREPCKWFEVLRYNVGFCNIKIEVPASYIIKTPCINTYYCDQCKFHEPENNDVQHMWEQGNNMQKYTDKHLESVPPEFIIALEISIPMVRGGDCSDSTCPVGILEETNRVLQTECNCIGKNSYWCPEYLSYDIIGWPACPCWRYGADLSVQIMQNLVTQWKNWARLQEGIMEISIEQRLKEAIGERKITVFEMVAFQKDPNLALLVGAKIGYLLGIGDGMEEHNE